MSSVTINSNVDIVKLKLQGAISRAAEQIGGIIEGHAKELCPVDTGYLRNSICHGRGGQYIQKHYSASKADENGEIRKGKCYVQLPSDDQYKRTAYVGTNVEYAPFVELGHAQQPGRFVPAIGKRLKADHVEAKPFLRPAWQDNMQEIGQALHNEMVRAGVDA